MPIPVALADVAEELELVGDEIHAYINRQTGELLSIGVEDLATAEEGYDPEEYADWEQAWRGAIGDDVEEPQRVHAIRSAAANVGAARLAETAGALEDLLLARLAGGQSVVPDDLRQRLGDDFRESWLAAANAWKETRPGPGGSACVCRCRRPRCLPGWRASIFMCWLLPSSLPPSSLSLPLPG